MERTGSPMSLPPNITAFQILDEVFDSAGIDALVRFFRENAIETLIIKRAQFLNDGFERIVSVFPTMPLRSLALSQMKFSHDNIRALCAALKQCTNIIVLNINGLDLKHDDIGCLVDYLGASTIETLSISFVQWGLDLIAKVLPMMLHLRSLNLSVSRYYNNEHDDEFIRSLANCRHIVDLSIDRICISEVSAVVLSEYLRSSAIESLKIKSAELTKQSVKTLSAALSTMPLKTLALVDNRLNCNDITIIVRAIEGCPGLTSLDLSQNIIRGNGIAAIMAACGSGRLNINELNISWNDFGTGCAMIIAQSLVNCPRVKSLNMTLCNIDLINETELSACFARAIAVSSIEHLNLSCNKLGNGARPILGIIPSSKIKFLNLEYTKIDKLVPDIIDLAMTNCDLQIDITNNDIDPAVVDDLAFTHPRCVIISNRAVSI